MNFNDGSCCKSSDKPTSLQTITFAILFGALFLSAIIIVYEVVCKSQPSHHRLDSIPIMSNLRRYHYQALPRPGYLTFCTFPTNNVTTFLFAFAKLALIVSYFYICDR